MKPFDVEALIHVLTTLVAPPTASSGPAAVFERTLGADGIHAALAFLNGCGAHRFSGIYRFDGDMLRNVHLVDRTDASVRVGPDAPMRETYCSIVTRERRPFRTVDTLKDDRLADHPARRMVQSYCGVLLRRGDGTLFGTLCNFDLVPQHSAPAELAVLWPIAVPPVVYPVPVSCVPAAAAVAAVESRRSSIAAADSAVQVPGTPAAPVGSV